MKRQLDFGELVARPAQNPFGRQLPPLNQRWLIQPNPEENPELALRSKP